MHRFYIGIRHVYGTGCFSFILCVLAVVVGILVVVHGGL